MKQFDMFGDELTPKGEEKYTSKIKAPIYEPKNRKPNVFELMDTYKTNRLITEIKNSNVTNNEKLFLIEAAKRHTVFNYRAIADYYAHSNSEMQSLMEHSALVIIDFEKAIQFGYIKLSEEMTQQYLSETGNGE